MPLVTPISIAVFLSHPNQHFAVSFRALSQLPFINLRVYYHNTRGTTHSALDKDFGCSYTWDVPLCEGYSYEVLEPKQNPVDFAFFEIDSPRVAPVLDQFQPDIVWIFGYNHRMCIRAMNWAHKHRRAVFFISDAELIHHRSPFKLFLKKLIVPKLLKRCTRIITVGDNNENYYSHYGVSQIKMARGCLPIDLNTFHRGLASYATIRMKIRKELDVGKQDLLFSYCGKLIERKRPLDIVRASAIVKNSSLQFKLIIIGMGPMNEIIQQEISNLGLKQTVIQLGFKNQSEVPSLLMASDVAVMASESDPHPLSITESMACGTTAIISDKVGCIGKTDVLQDENTGLTYPCGNVQELSKCMLKLIHNRPLLAELRTKARVMAMSQGTETLIAAIFRSILTLDSEQYLKSQKCHAIQNIRDWVIKYDKVPCSDTLPLLNPLSAND
ncbi:MAG: glycosyltransferase family 4 protein [Proteobacteria bacterium]|nr:glycosyltransferase family 4 protein [Pseudomonadota bacterium]